MQIAYGTPLRDWKCGSRLSAVPFLPGSRSSCAQLILLIRSERIYGTPSHILCFSTQTGPGMPRMRVFPIRANCFCEHCPPDFEGLFSRRCTANECLFILRQYNAILSNGDHRIQHFCEHCPRNLERFPLPQGAPFHTAAVLQNIGKTAIIETNTSVNTACQNLRGSLHGEVSIAAGRQKHAPANLPMKILRLQIIRERRRNNTTVDELLLSLR
jgi:hypothetical protein